MRVKYGMARKRAANLAMQAAQRITETANSQESQELVETYARLIQAEGVTETPTQARMMVEAAVAYSLATVGANATPHRRRSWPIVAVLVLLVGALVFVAVKYGGSVSDQKDRKANSPGQTPFVMVPVKSSAMQAVGYDPARHVLRIRFQTGAEYDYSGVPQAVYDGLLAADWHGSYFHRQIKGRYQYQRVR